MQGHFAPFNCLVLGHAKYKGVQRVYCKIFPKKMFHGSPSMDPVIIRPPGVDNGAFVVSPETVWYALSQRNGVGSIPANSDAQNVPSFRRWRFEMKHSPFFGMLVCCFCSPILLWPTMDPSPSIVPSFQVSTLKTLDDPENGNYSYYKYYVMA
jgi:hypothetical protein